MSNDITRDDRAVGECEGDGFEVELGALVDESSFAFRLHREDDRGVERSGAQQESERREAIIRLVGLRKRFGAQVVLDGLDLEIGEGRTIVVLGASGSGKSVLLKHIVGLIRPDEGEVWFGGVRVDTMGERAWGAVRKQIGFLFQLSALFDSMTVRENLEFPLVEHTSLKARARRDRVAEVLEHVDLDGVMDKRPAELSGGQQKRVALARAIIMKPRAILYDKPTTGLDPIRADGIARLINRMKRDLGVTSVVVTHDLEAAAKVADRVVLIGDGRVIADGTLDDLRRSRDARVRHFIEGKDVETREAVEEASA